MRVAIVEGENTLRESLKILLSGQADITIVGTYNNAETALKGLKSASPDVIVVDIMLPGMSGIEFIKQTKSASPNTDFMVYTMYEDKDMVFSAIKAGASGYMLKGCSPREFIESLYSIHNGGAPMSPKIARLVIQKLQDGGISSQYILTNKEKEVLRLIEKGMSYKETGRQLNISGHTVHSHIKNVYEKLHAKNRQDALITARKKCLI